MGRLDVNIKGNFHVFLGHIAIFIAAGLLVAPLTNELLIMNTLFAYKCQFVQKAGFDILHGISVYTYPLCGLHPVQRLFLQSVGSLGNLIISFSLVVLSLVSRISKRKTLSGILAYYSLGIMSSPILLMISGFGELYDMLYALGLHSTIWVLPATGMALTGLGTAFLLYQMKFLYDSSR